MEKETRMIHVRVPVSLIKEVDSFVNQHKGTKTAFFVNAVAEQLRREKARQTFKKLRGSLKPEDVPEWAACGCGRKWVQKMRGEEKDVSKWPTL